METSETDSPGADLRLKQLSYSSVLTFHTCPRKFELYKLGAARTAQDISGSVTFAYGHVVGLGIQLVLEGKSESEIMVRLFQAWDVDILEFNSKQNKSFWLALTAVQKFITMYQCGFLKEWELVTYQGKPATELSFLIHLPDGFVYRGFVDAVLRHRDTGEIMVLECKTTSSQYLSGAEYKNSSQAIGYSIVLDSLFPGLSSYQVLYLVYKTKSMEYETLPFAKSYLARAQWIQELLMEVQKIQMHSAMGVFSMHGESCNNFYRECEYFGTCTLATKHLTVPLTDEMIEAIQTENQSYQIQLSIQDLIATQLSLSEGQE